MIKILIGGSPCTYWSVAQKKGREVTAEGLGWELFKNYLIAKEKFKPDFFLYENNKSAAQPIKDQISHELGVELMHINSALVSAQNRQRFYAFNWDVEQPQDRGILLRDILESAASYQEKEHSIPQPAAVDLQVVGRKRNEDGEFERSWEARTDGKSSALTTISSRRMVAEPIALNTTAEGKAQCIRATCYKDGIRNLVGNKVDRRTCAAHPVKVGELGNGGQGNRIYSVEGKSVAQTATSGGLGASTGLYAVPAFIPSDNPIYEVVNREIEIKGKKYPIKLPDGLYIIRKLTPTECERLQTLPDGYTAAVSNTQRYRGLGNGWTAEVIIHILQGALKDIPRDEEIVVLSMYDGIGTGRYCLDKMGFTNVTYYAYEIDEPAMKVSRSNYPDIIQLGDAFDLRREDWELGKHFDHARETENESQETDLSDAPEEVKKKILENDDALKKRDEHTDLLLPDGFSVIDQLAELLAERKKLHIIDEDNVKYDCDIIAIEYAIHRLKQ